MGHMDGSPSSNIEGVPGKFEIFAPDGTKGSAEGWIALGNDPKTLNQTRLFVVKKNGQMGQTFNKKVVIINQDNGVIVYNPRSHHNGCFIPIGRPILSEADHKWLDDHPEWPAILEIDSKPTEENDGLYQPQE